jgi:hypothetical protein
MAAERPLYIRPWYWRLALLDAVDILKRRLAR